MGPIDCPEMSVRHYNYLLCNNTEERGSLLATVSNMQKGKHANVLSFSLKYGKLNIQYKKNGLD